MAKVKTKEQYIQDFNQMRDVEQGAHDYYSKIAGDLSIQDESVRETFAKIADEEQQHVEMVERIINIINNNL